MPDVPFWALWIFGAGVFASSGIWWVLLKFADRQDRREIGEYVAPVDAAASVSASTHPELHPNTAPPYDQDAFPHKQFVRRLHRARGNK